MPQILIVEDDLALSNLYSTIFKRDGFDVLTARDGKEGLELALTKKPNFMLSDVELGSGMTGIEMFEKIVADPAGKGIPVIFLTGKVANAETKDRAMKLGARDYLAKGMDSPEEIVNRVKKELGLLTD